MEKIGQYTIKIDFYSDWVEHMRQVLSRAGYNLSPNVSDADVCKQFFNLQRHRITSRPRNVLVSKEFQCPLDQEEGLRAFREKVERGDDLNPHLGRRRKPTQFNDPMLNDWGIYHFHLGLTLESNGFIKRSGPVLFARVISNTAYFVDIREHGKGHKDVWTKREIMEIVHKNWPESLAEYESGYKNLSPKLTEEQLADFRYAGIMTGLEMEDGTVYLPPGGGYMADRTSANVIMTCNQNTQHLKQREERFKENIAAIAIEISKVTGYNGLDFEFELEVVDGKFIALEQNSKARLELFDEFDFTDD